MTVAIAGVLTTMGLNALGSMRRKSEIQRAVPMLATSISAARAEAFARGAPTVVLVRTVDGRVNWEWFVDPEGDFDPATTSAPAEGDVVLGGGELPSEVALVDDASELPKAPAPLHRVPAATGCTFCDGPEQTGAIVFGTDGRVRLGAAPETRPLGGSLTFRVEGAVPRHESVLVVAASGLVRRIDR